MYKKYFQAKISSFIVLFLVLAFIGANSQNETGVRYVSSTYPYIYNPTKDFFKIRYPIIRSIPPLSISMPYDILLSYIYSDSLCRFGYYDTLNNHFNRWTTLNDTLTGMAKYLYKMCDYNPMIFKQYTCQTYPNKKYLTSIETNQDLVSNKLKKLLPDSMNLAIYTLLESDYILHVNIVAIDSIKDTNHLYTYMDYYYNAYATIIDTIKGQKIPQEIISDIINKNKKNNKVMTDPITVFRFQYTQHTLFLPWDGTVPYQKADSAFCTNDGSFKLYQGQEAIIFVKHKDRRVDSLADYFNLDLDCQLSYNALPVIDGNVRDINNVWSPNLLLNYSDWKTRVNFLINKILNMSY